MFSVSYTGISTMRNLRFLSSTDYTRSSRDNAELFNIETVHAIRSSKLRQWASVPGTASGQGVSSLARCGQEN